MLLTETTNRESDLALQFILNTDRSVFLTGRAGTGKTTLLREIIKKSKKRLAVVAPTGVAAINAKGVTIHSLFQLPTTAFAPTSDPIDNEHVNNRSILAKNQKLRRERRQLLIELELLIIDEISMVRADLLDAIDYTLRRIKKNQQPFGGTQLLVIGDLFQLAPIVKPDEWNTLSNYYSSPFFFDSLAWKQLGAITIELQKVYRQTDETFINILNRIRNGTPQDSDITTLNERYTESVDRDDDIITLTTHNRKAKVINDGELAALDTKEEELKAVVTGKFSPSAYPTNEVIQVKEEAQIMFVKNHPDGLYYNGKLGIIESINEEKIRVYLKEDDTTLEVYPEEWQNTKYTVDPDTKKIVQENIGSFTQYPFRLAWAITVHKSQGLTFENVILDVENTFAPGQLYVALSRCRSLEGIRLSTKVHRHNVIVDERVTSFYDNISLQEDIDHLLSKEKEAFEWRVLLESFTLDKLILYAQNWREYTLEKELPDKSEVLSLGKILLGRLNTINDVVYKFHAQIKELEKQNTSTEIIRKRCIKAIEYFTTQMHDMIIIELEQHIKSWKRKSGIRQYNNLTQDIIDDCWNYIDRLYHLRLKDAVIYEEEKKFKRVVLFDPDRKTKRKKKVKGETYQITLDSFEKGHTLPEIAKERQLALSTIESHMGRLLKEGKVEIEELLSPSRIEKLSKLFTNMKEASSKDIIASADYKVTYSEINWIRYHLEKQEN